MDNYFDISGCWKFRSDLERIGIEKKYFLDEFEDTITLPNTVSAAQKVPKTNKRYDGYLTDPYESEGYMWFAKDIELEHYSCDKLYSLTLERTRISHVWIDGKYVGTQNSLCTSHNYDITEYASKSFRVVIMTSNVGYPTKGGHMTSPDTQTNWNGITGRIAIVAKDKAYLEKTKLIPDVSNMTLKVITTLCGEDSANAEILINDQMFAECVELKNGENTIELKLGDGFKLWSEFEPNIYQISIYLSGGTEKAFTSDFGMRNFYANGDFFEINGTKTFLRGKHDGLIFPKTGYAPTDLISWLKVMKTAKDHGINHYRFHTCCPPEAAFTAADILGIYMEPELPFWGTIHAKGEEGYNENEQKYLIEEGFRIIDEFSNHPSFVMMSMGNELWGSPERIKEIVADFKKYNCSILYTGGSNNFQFCPLTFEEEDFFVGVRFDKNALIRGSYAMCDAPLGFVQTDIPGTAHSYDRFFTTASHGSTDQTSEIEIQYGTGVKKVKAVRADSFLPNKPVISHEVGQYCMYPNFEQIEKYSGVLKPYNFEIFRERLENAGMLEMAPKFFRDSSKLAVDCYKLEIEAARRSKKLAGFQLLDIQDFTGQGTAVVGILDSFMESKGVISAEKWREFCGESVLLAEFQRYVWYDGENFTANIIVSGYNQKSFDNARIEAELKFENGISVKKEFSFGGKMQGVSNVGSFAAEIKAHDKPQKMLLTLKSEALGISNSYKLFAYPKADKDLINTLERAAENGFAAISSVFLTSNADAASELLKYGKTVILISDKIKNGIKGTYCTDFWCYPMFRQISESMNKQVPIGTLGLTISAENEAMSKFGADTYTTPIWYDIIENSNCADLSETRITPIAQMIDNFERNKKLAVLFEACAYNGKLIALTCNLSALVSSHEAVYLIKCLIEYTSKESFCPAKSIDGTDFERIFSTDLNSLK